MSAHVVKRTWSIKYSQKLHDGSVRRSRSARMCSSYWSMHREYDASSRWRNLPSTTFHDSELRASMRSGSHSRTHLNIQHDTPDRPATALHTWIYSTTHLPDQPELVTPVQHTAWHTWSGTTWHTCTTQGTHEMVTWHMWTTYGTTHLTTWHTWRTRKHLISYNMTHLTSYNLTNMNNVWHDTPDEP